jgi:hypothetical protein
MAPPKKYQNEAQRKSAAAAAKKKSRQTQKEKKAEAGGQPTAPLGLPLGSNPGYLPLTHSEVRSKCTLLHNRLSLIR